MQSRTDHPEAVSDRSASDEGARVSFHQAIASRLHIPLAGQAGGDFDDLYHRILPLSRRARITRIGDITGLDRIGLPVVQAVRPAAQSEVTSLGRGFQVAEAAVGAIMESLERFYSESISADRIYLACANDLDIENGLFENLIAAAHPGDWRRMTIPWIDGINVVTGVSQPVPLELVHTSYTDPPPRHDGIFLRTTTGLACHTSCYGAFLQGLFECVERDAIARAFETHGFFDRARIERTNLGARVDDVLALAGRQGISFGLWHARSPAKVPVIWCQTIETGRAEPILALPTEGHAAGPSIEIAASGAMLEALAARAGAISGARDDQTIEHYRRSTDAIVANARRLIMDDSAAMRPGAEVSLPVASLGTLIDRVVSAGLGPVIAVLVASDAETGVRCVRTILPQARPLAVVR